MSLLEPDRRRLSAGGTIVDKSSSSSSSSWSAESKPVEIVSLHSLTTQRPDKQLDKTSSEVRAEHTRLDYRNRAGLFTLLVTLPQCYSNNLYHIAFICTAKFISKCFTFARLQLEVGYTRIFFWQQLYRRRDAFGCQLVCKRV